MPRTLKPSSTETNPQLSHAINLFLHKDRTSFFDDDAIASGIVAPFELPAPLVEPPLLNWDLQCTSLPLVPALRYIAAKLRLRGLSVALIISEHQPYIIPVWSLPRKSQVILLQIVRKAVKKFSVPSSWLTALAAATNKCLPRIFDAHQPNSYIVRRSLVQHEVVFSEEGFTVLTIDHIHTFKQLLCTLSNKNWVPRAREVCLSSCVHLLQRINEIYTDPKISRGYIARVYKEIDFCKEAYEEVISAYDSNYCTASIKDVTTLEPDCTALSTIEPDVELGTQTEPRSTSVAELPDNTTPHNRNEGLISPIDTIDSRILDDWRDPRDDESLDTISPMTVKYATVHRQRHSEVPESPLDPDAPWMPAAPTSLNPQRVSTLPTPISESPCEESKAMFAKHLPLPPLETTECVTRDTLPQSRSDNTKSLGDPMSPLGYVRIWVESWSTAAPKVLCENCHDVAVQPILSRRFTMAS